MPLHATVTAAENLSDSTMRSRGNAPHRNNAAPRSRSDSPYQHRATLRDNPTQQLIKQAVDFLLQQLEAGKSEPLWGWASRPESAIAPIPPRKQLGLSL